MQTRKLITLLIFVTITLMFLTSSVWAQDTSATPTTKRVQRLENIREKIGTKPGALKNFLKGPRAIIGSATVTAKSDVTLSIQTKEGKDVTVNVDTNTKYRRKFWGKSSFDEIQIGDKLNVVGKWTDDAKTTIQALLIRDASIQKRHGVFFGTVTYVTSTGWVMDTKRGSQTVSVTTSTEYKNRKGEKITQSDIQAGHRVRIKGLWDTQAHTVTEVTEVRDFSLPAKSTTGTTQ